MGARGAPRTIAAPQAPSMLLPVNLLLKEHVAADRAIFRALAATCFALARRLRHECVHFFLASDVLGRARDMVEDLHQIEVRFPGALIAVREDIIILDPAFGLRELLLLPVLARQIVGVSR